MLNLYGLIGFPLGHSRSAEYFNRKFDLEGYHHHRYRLYPLPAIQGVRNLLQEHPNLRGFNVTIPFKEQIVPYLNFTDPEAAVIGSINVVLVDRLSGLPVLTGYNTDGPAFLSTLEGLKAHRKALILGTGGAAKAVAWAMRQAGISYIFVTRRSPGPERISYRHLAEERDLLREHTLIVNATPAGMFPHTSTCPNIPYELLGPEHLLYDLVYNPEETLFMQKGKAHGARIRSGEDMFTKQADLSYALFLR